MPSFNGKRKKYNKKKRKQRVPRYSLVNRTSSPLPSLLRTKMRYADHIFLNPTSVAAGTQVYRVNGMYDPDYTGVGAQPRGFDELMDLYKHYRVNYARITIDLSNITNDEDMMFLAGVALRNTTTISTTAYDYIEQGDVSYKALTGYDGSRCIIRLKYAASPYKYLNVSYKDDSLQGTVSTNPDNECYFHLFYQPVSTGTDYGGAEVYVLIEYDVTFAEPNVLAAS